MFQIGDDSPLAGTYRGQETVRSMVDGVVQMMGESFRMDPVDVLADDRHVAIIFHTTASRT